MSNIIKVLKTTLKGSLSTTGTSFTVQKFVDSKDVEVVDADFNGNFVVVITQGTNIEMILCSAIVQSGTDDTAVLTVATNGRHLNPKSPWTGGATGILFTAGANITVTNDPYTMSRLASLDKAQTFTLLQTFDVIPQSADVPTVGNDLINKTYADALVLGALTTVNVVVPATAGETVSAGDLLYFDTTDNEWKLCDADTASTVENVLLAIAQGAGTNGNAITGGVILRGLDSNQSGMTQGDIMYASNTAGSIGSSAGTKEVTIGIAKSATTLYFNPRFNQQLTEDQQDALAGKSGTAPSASNLFIDEADVDTAVTASKIVRRNSDGSISGATKFGGDGTDGALDTSSGTVNVDLGGLAYVVKNYTSINVVTNNLTFTNANANGTTIILKSQGNVTVSATIDASGMGASGGGGGTGGTSGANPVAGSNGNNGNNILDTSNHYGAGASGSATTASTGGVVYGNQFLYTVGSSDIYRKSIMMTCGSGGGGGGGAQSNPTGNGGAGGAGGGAVLIECGGDLNFTGTLDVSGDAGTVGASVSGTTYNIASAGGGGGGAGGMGIILYNTQTAVSGTINSAGGAGGAGGNATDSSGGSGGNTSAVGNGGAGAGSYTGAGGNGAPAPSSGGNNNGNNGNAGAVGAGGGGGSGASALYNSTTTTTGGSGGAGGASAGGLVIANTEF